VADFDDDGQTFRRPTPFRQSSAGPASSEGIDATAKRPTPLRPSHSAPPPDVSDTRPSKPEPARPDTIIDGRYRVLARLAAGGMGEVLKVEHIELGKKLALKVMLPALSSDDEFVARFKTEAVAVSRIGHPNIIDVTDFGRTPEGRFYFVMELLEGLTLASALHRGGPMPVERVAKVGSQAARALAAAHAVGIVHRDLKPENLMLVRRGEETDVVKVLDFGVAKVQVSAGGTGQTVAGLVVGTPMYMSPEQARALPVDHRTDIYSLGLILYELISGRTPFTGETPPILMVKHVTERPPALQPGPIEGVPNALEALIFRMLEKEAEKRPQSMTEIAETLEGLMHVRTSARRAKVNEAPLEVPKSKLPWLGLAGLVVLLGVGAVFATSKPEAEQVTAPAPIVQPPPLVEVLVPPATPESVVVQLQSNPSGAEVSSDGVLLGTTPFSLRRPAGAQLPLTVTLAGHETLQRKLGFESSQTVTLTLLPTKTTPVVEPRKKKTMNRVAPELRDDPYLQTEDLKDLPTE
jgi:serine/threonine protein kinase